MKGLSNDNVTWMEYRRAHVIYLERVGVSEIKTVNEILKARGKEKDHSMKNKAFLSIWKTGN